MCSRRCSGTTDCTLVRATSADEALLCLVRHEFAALVLDIKMPGMNGIELATLIKQRKRSQHVPILFLTAHSVDEDDVLRGYGVGRRRLSRASRSTRRSCGRKSASSSTRSGRRARWPSLNEALQREIAEREKAQEALQRANLELEHRVQRADGGADPRAPGRPRERRAAAHGAGSRAASRAWEWHLSLGTDAMVDRPGSAVRLSEGIVRPGACGSSAPSIPTIAPRVEAAIAAAL